MTRKNSSFTAINPALFQQPVRGYPLRHTTDSGVFVAGERAGQKVQPQGNIMHGQTPLGPSGMPMNIHQQQAMVAHQSNNMEIMERRHRERQAAERTANPQGVSSRFFFFQSFVHGLRYFSFSDRRAPKMMIPEASFHWPALSTFYIENRYLTVYPQMRLSKCQQERCLWRATSATTN